MKSIRIVNVNGMQQGKTALLTTATPQDRYRIGTEWHAATGWEHGKSVDEVNHFGRHTTAKGDLLSVKSFEGEVVAQVKVIDIQMAEPARLSDADFQDLGYETRQDYMADWGNVLGGKTWLLKVRHTLQ